MSYSDTYSDTYDADGAAPASADFPTLLIEIAFDTNPNATSDTWTDVTAHCVSARGLTIRRGRRRKFDDFEPGRCTLWLKNTIANARRFDPQNQSGPYYTKLTPNRRLRVSATYNGTTYRLFVGFIEAWPQDTDTADNVGFVQITAVDELQQLAKTGSIGKREVRPLRPWVLDDATYGTVDDDNLVGGIPTFTTERSGARISTILTAVGVPDARVDIDPGVSLVMGDEPSDDTVGYLRKIVKTELGKLYVRADGTIAFEERNHWTYTANQLSSTATFSDQASASYRYSAIVFEPESDRNIRNAIRRGRRGGNAFLKQDSTSVDKYGLLEDNDTDLLFEPVTEAADQATYLLAQFSSGYLRVAGLEIQPRRNSSVLFPQVLGREIGDRITVRRTPLQTGSEIADPATGTAPALWIEGIEHRVGSETWVTTWDTSKAEQNVYFTLNNATLGIIDNGVLVAY